jgi:phosphatidylserine/phosphatidylglycerophosphate/cardiolipin synthase-like enzyme
LEVAFSPKQGVTELVIKAISDAHKSIRVAAYSFTSRPIAQALVDAHRHGIEVMAVLDKSNKTARYSSARGVLK